MPYKSPLDEYCFMFDHVVGFSHLNETERYNEITIDFVRAILEEAGKLFEKVMVPLQREGDKYPAGLENGVVRTSPGYAKGYKAIAKGGWVAIAAEPKYGGMGLPVSVATAVNEMMSAACLSLQLNPLMTQGQIEALEKHASEEIKNIYLPKLISGEWCGTMNLTEPQAGSDVGALISKAEENGDGTYAITGQKIYISWGDNDFSENICHLVLARLPGGAPGTKGISLFLVPKKIPDENGNAAISNTLKVVSLEHKMGLHGSPTAVMQYEAAKGWLVGKPHAGMKAMFTMMNNARLGVGVQGIGVAEAAYQHALDFAKSRRQGKSTLPNGLHTIIDHPDVRRMLTTMKADIFASRSIALANAVAIDMANATNNENWKSRAALLTPITKAFGTDIGVGVADLGVQIHGGMGFIEETGAAQYLRDVRITPIYEGTNGIQSMDLVGRKLMDGGEAVYALLDEMSDISKTCDKNYEDLSACLLDAIENLRETTDWMLLQHDLNDRFAGAVPYLKAFARILGGYYHLRAATYENGSGSRTKLARFYIRSLMPECIGLLKQASQGAKDLFAMDIEDLVA